MNVQGRGTKWPKAAQRNSSAQQSQGPHAQLADQVVATAFAWE